MLRARRSRVRFPMRPIFQPHYGPGVDSASNRNEYQESSWGKGRPAHKADNLTTTCEPIVYKMWELRRLTTLWTTTVCYSNSFTFTRRPCVAQAVSRWLPTVAARVRVRAPCGFCGGQSGIGAGFLRVLRFPLPIIPPNSPSS
jgi:hypothetical protein